MQSFYSVLRPKRDLKRAGFHRNGRRNGDDMVATPIDRFDLGELIKCFTASSSYEKLFELLNLSPFWNFAVPQRSTPPKSDNGWIRLSRVQEDEYIGLATFAIFEGFILEDGQPDVHGFLRAVGKGHLFSCASVVGSTIKSYHDLQDQYYALLGQVHQSNQHLNVDFHSILRKACPGQPIDSVESFDSIPNDEAKSSFLQQMWTDIKPITDAFSGCIKKISGKTDPAEMFGRLSTVASKGSLLFFPTFFKGFVKGTKTFIRNVAHQEHAILKGVHEVAACIAPSAEFVAAESLRLQMTCRQMRNTNAIIRAATTHLSTPEGECHCQSEGQEPGAASGVAAGPKRLRSQGFMPAEHEVTKK
eukprot:580988-Hanusia_phi.AAC.4